MRVWFVPLLMLSVLIGWTLGLAGCVLAAGQGWDPPPGWGEPVELLPIPSAADPLGGPSFEGVSMRDPSAPDAGTPSDAGGASDAAPLSDAGEPVSGAESVDAGPLLELIGRCGDGTMQFGELCDDGNTVGGDGCSALCFPE